MDEKQLLALFDSLSPRMDLGDFKTFKNNLSSDANYRSAFFQEASKDHELGDFKAFESSFKKKVGSTPSQTSPSQSPLTFQDLGKISRQTPVSDSPSPTAQIETRVKATEMAQGNQPVVTVKEKHTQQVQAAKQKLNNAIQNSDPILTNMIREGRVAQLEAEVATTPGMDNFRNPALETAKKDLFTKVPVTSEEVAAQKEAAVNDQQIGREVIRRTAKKDKSVASSAYLVDAELRAEEDPNKITTILDNAKKIEDGELRYNIRKGTLEKPENFIISGIRGFQERSKQLEDYKFFTETKNDAAVISQLEADMKDYDPDRPIPVAEGGASQFTQMLGMEGVPILKSVGSAVVTGMIPGAQAAAPYVAAAASAPEYYERGYASAFRETYYDMRRRGKSETEALEIARKQAESEGNLSAIEGAASAAIGARIGFKPTSITNSPGLKNALRNVVKASGNFIKENIPEGVSDAAVAGTLQIAKNIEARDNGLDRDILDGVQENVAGELLFTVGVGSLTQSGRTVLNPETYNTLRTFVARQPKEAVDAKIGEMVATGKVTPKAAEEIGKEVEKARQEDAKIPSEISDEGVRGQIQTKIEQREDLKKKLATVDEAFHAPIKEQIKSIESEILNLSTNATSQSTIQERSQQSNIQEPARIEGGQSEIGQGTGAERQGAISQTNAGDSNKGSSGAVVTLAPFFNTTITSTQDAYRLRQTPEYKAYVDSIPKLAKELGLEVDTVNETIGGFENQQGEKIVEVSNRVFLKNATVDQAERFAAIMGTMTPETQEATIAAKYVTKDESENVDPTEYVEELTMEVGNLNDAIASLKKAGITDFTIDQDAGTISFLDFSKGQDVEFDNKIANFVEDLASKSIYYGENSRRPAQSRYISPERRAQVLAEIENDAARLQQGGPNLRSIINEAKARDEAFRNKGQEVVSQEVKDISDTANKLLNKFSKIAQGVELFTDNYDGVTRQLLSDNVITNADYNSISKAKGFYDPTTNKIYLNPKRFTADTPIHEFGHVWFGILKKYNPELYEKGLSLAQDVNLGEAYSNLDDADYREEYLVDLIGKKGSEILKDRSAISQWVRDVFNYIKNALGLTGDFENITLDEFVKMGAEDVISGGKVTGVRGEADQQGVIRAQSDNKEHLEKLRSNNVESRVKAGRKVSTRTPSAKGAPEDVHTSSKYIIDLKSARENATNYINNAIEVSGYPVLGKVSKPDMAALQRGILPKSKGGTEIDVKKAVKVADKIYDKFVRVVADNLKWLHDHFDETLRDISHRWYDGANVIAQDYASKYDVTEDQAAGVIAVLSPQMDWYKNVSLAERVLDIVKTKRNFIFDEKMADKYVELAGKLQQGKNETDQEFEDRTVRSIEKAKQEVTDLIGKPLDASKEYFPRTLRTYDETYNDKSYDILTPNGEPVGKALKADGDPASIGWQGYSTIAKAISIIENGDIENISRQLGDMHKVRNFFNNITDPNSDTGDVTIDTHAVAAGLLKPLAGKDNEVKMNLSGKGSAITGVTGTYPAFADAYRLAAKDKGILPRQMQSITWEAVRGLFKDTWKSNEKNKAKINDLWDNYLKGKTSIDETRKLIDEAAGGVETPSWARPGSSAVIEAGDGSDAGELSGSSIMGSESGAGRGTTGEREAGVVQQTSAKVKLQADKQSIIEEAKANGTFMQAPNGKPTKLTEDQWATVRTPQFKNWFGDWQNDPENASKIVDENGEPLVVYHGTNVRFDEFNKEKLGSKNWMADSAYTGFFFAKDEKTSQAYVGMNNADWMGMSLGQSPILTNVIDKYKSELESAKKAVRDVLDSEIEKVKAKREVELAPVIDKLKKEGISEDIIKRFVDNFPGGNEAFENANRINIENGNQQRVKDIEYKIFKDVEQGWLKAKGLEPIILNLFLNIRDPFVFDFKNSKDQEGLTGKIKAAKLNGNDGVVFKNLADGGDIDDIFVAFEPNQIKSATDNSGEFSTSSNNIKLQDDEQNARARNAGRIQPAPIKGVVPKKLGQIIFDAVTGTNQKTTYTKTPRALGSYTPSSKIVKVRYEGDLDTTAHEIGHSIDDEYGVMAKIEKNSAAVQELKQFSPYGSKPPRKHPDPARYRRGEGFAEFIRAYIVNPDAASKAAPELSKIMRDTLPSKVQESLKQFSDDVRAWAGSSAVDQIAANVQIEPEKGETFLQRLFLKSKSGDFSVNWADRVGRAFLDPLRVFEKAIDHAKGLKGIDELMPSKDPLLLARLLNGFDAKFGDAMENGMFDANLERMKTEDGKVMNIEWLVEPLADADENGRPIAVDEKEVKERMKRVISYMIAERTVELSKRFDRKSIISGIGAGIFTDLNVAERAIAELSGREDFGKIEEAAKRYRQMADATLRYLVDKGRLAEAQYDKEGNLVGGYEFIKRNNMQYAAMQRVFESEPGEVIETRFGSGGKALGSKAEILQKAKGSSKAIINPYIPLLENVHKSFREADRNEILKTFRDLLVEPRMMGEGDPKRFSDIGAKVSEPGNGVITIFVNGKPEYWKFQKDIYNALKNLDTDGYKLPALLTALPRALRWSVTNFPVFALRNVIRDFQHRMALSNEGSTLQKIKSLYSTKSEHDNAAKAGALNGGLYMVDKTMYYGLMDEAVKNITNNGGFVITADALKKGWEKYGNLLYKSENVNRIAEYKNAYDKAKTKGLNDYDASLYAASRSRGLIDFAVAGHVMQYVNQLIPFSNAAVQGLRSSYKRISENPTGFAGRTLLYSILPQVAFWYLNHQDDDDKKEYESLPDYQRDMFYNLKIGDKWLSIPKPFELGLVASSVDRMMSYVNGNKKAYDGFGGSIAKAMFPFDESNVAGPYQKFVEMQANYDFFREENIIPPHEANLRIALRNTQTASRLGKFLGKILDEDPRMMDFFVRGQFSYFGNLATKLSNIGRPDARLKFDISDTGLMKNYPAYSSKPVQEFLDYAKENNLTRTEFYDIIMLMSQSYFNEKDPEIKERKGLELMDVSQRILDAWKSVNMDDVMEMKMKANEDN